ncbi:hypothetical protein DY023_03970 [Microbacterium bovistercoris]|uniref:Bax inhibitor-1/YccA family protein n=1 Tax=Microbacterium bovistercoris TaxID=2293570 RepID=A0A371NWF3_9MICO|nr:Bax inhibitor-1/YccA family protein [Microbacterium bovistercoris]REJ07364.1 hypothetical protein DY023_03970 [Microbacterium bovistercoris]
MTLSNPVLNSVAFRGPARVGGTAAGRINDVAPAVASGHRMTFAGAVGRTAVLFAVLLATAVGGWEWTRITGTGLAGMIPWIVGGAAAIVLGITVGVTSRTRVRPGLIVAFAAVEGMVVGSVSAWFDHRYPGVVLQAVLATLVVTGITLLLSATGLVRANRRATRVWIVAMIGYVLFTAVDALLAWTGIVPDAFGTHGQQLFGLPLAYLIGAFVVVMAAYALIRDFDAIREGVRSGVPSDRAWLGAFGVMVTIVWLYLEVLRILGRARS